MAGTFSAPLTEARGFTAAPADLDKLAVVVGCSSAGVGLSPFYFSGGAAVAGVGYGDAVDILTQIIEQRQASGNAGNKLPAALYSTPITTTGAYGTIDTSGVAGTSVVTVDSSSKPYGTYEARIRVYLGGTVGSAGVQLQWSLDAGRTWSNIIGLGTATSFTIPNSRVKLNFAAGTLTTGDLIAVRTLAPAPSSADVAAAFSALATSGLDFSIVVLGFPVSASLVPTITTGLNALAAVGKRVLLLAPTRIPNAETPESETAWLSSIAADFAAYTDSRICMRAGYGLVTDAMTSRVYLRSTIAQFAADVVRCDRSTWPCAPADQPESSVTLSDYTGNTVGHDEGPMGGATGLSNETLGNRFSCEQRITNPATRQAVFNTVPWVLYAADERIRNMMVRRIANAMERVAFAAVIQNFGAKAFYTPPNPNVVGSQATLTPTSRRAIQGTVYGILSTVFASDIKNANDANIETGLVQVSSTVTVTGGNLLTVPMTLAPEVAGYVLSIPMLFAIKGAA